MKKISLSICILLLALILKSQTPSLNFSVIKEINNTSTSGSIGTVVMAQTGGRVYYVATDGISGSELWKTDGITGPTIVKDINPGSIGSGITSIVEGAGILYFPANDGVNGNELWRSDGTSSGTYLVKDIAPGAASSNANQFFYYNGILYFTANNNTNGTELWKSDGTSAGTVLVKDINLGSASAMAVGFTLNAFVGLGSNVYFPANNGTSGRELWKTDGTDVGTTLVRDIFVGISGSINFLKAAAHNGKLFFAATNGSLNGTELWSTDGTTAGTNIVKDIVVGSGQSLPNNLIEYNNKLCFSASSTNSATPDLYVSDGTSTGTVKIKDMAAAGITLNLGSVAQTNQFTVFDNKLAFVSIGGTNGSELYVSDGTNAGTNLVKDINPGSANSSPNGLLVFNNKLYFSAFTYTNGLYSSDGTNTGTVALISSPLAEELSVIGGARVFLGNSIFYAGNSVAKGSELWSTDVTSNNTVVYELNITKAGIPAQPFLFGSVVVNGEYYFGAADNNSGTELWKSNGTDAGTVKIKDIFSGIGSSSPQNFFAFNGVIYFSANDGINGIELWKTDGTEAGTQMVADIFPGSGSSSPFRIQSSGSNLYFLANSPLYGTEMWRSNGTAAGTTLFLDLLPGTASGLNNSIDYITLGDNAYYLANITAGNSLNIPAGIRLIRIDDANSLFLDFAPVITNGNDLATVGNTLFIAGSNSTNQTLLWKSINGGPVTQVKLLSTTSTSAYQMADCNGKLYFNASNGTSGNEPWVSDGTDAGTFLLKDINPGNIPSQPFQFVFSAGKVFFQASASGNDFELWSTDGTSAGTTLVKDIFPGSAGGSFPSGMIATSQNNVLFIANDGINGNELWKSDGTSTGTTLVQDFNSAGDGFAIVSRFFNYPQDYVLNNVNNSLLFFARNATTGLQLYGGKIGPKKLYVNDNSQTGDVFTTAIGNNANQGTQSSPVATVSYALTLAQADDSIFVDAGNYAEQIIIDKGITIKGAGKNLTLIVTPIGPLQPAPGPFTEIGLIETVQNIGDVHISNLTVISNDSDPSQNIIIQSGGSVKNCKLMNGGQGIFFRIDSILRSAVIENNEIQPRGIGINCQGRKLTASIINNNISKPSGYYAGIFAGLDFGPLVQLTVSGNIIHNYFGTGILGNSFNSQITQNSIIGTGSYAIERFNGSVPNATCNWFGTNNAEDIFPKIKGIVNYSPWLSNGTDSSAALGFQPLLNVCNGRQNKFYVNDTIQAGDVFTTAVGSNSNNGFLSKPFATITYAISKAQAGDTIFIDAGNYLAADITINKSVTILGSNYLLSPNNATNASLINSTRNTETMINDSTWTIAANNINLEGLTFNSTSKQVISLNNVNFGNIKLAKNRVTINSSATLLDFNGVGTTITAPSALINSGLTITDNRFEKYDAEGGATVNIGKFKNVIVSNNAFVVAGTTMRTQIASSFGNSGVTDSIYFNNNTVDNASSAFSGARFATTFVNGNKINSCRNAFVATNSILGSSNVYFTNNTITGTDGIVPFINYNRTNGSGAGASSSITIENNSITGTAIAGVTTLLGSMNLIFTNNVLSPSLVVRNNKITFAGDLSSVPAHFIRPIVLRGNLANAVVEKNEINLTGINQQQRTANVDLPVSPAITLHPDNGTNSFLQSGSVINILNNKINGFKHSFAVYDAVNGRDTYIGYGNIYSDVSVNVNNNSFTGDSISINNGMNSQIINATCNWYGSASLQNVVPKITPTTVNYVPWLTKGTNTNIATGFLPVASVCNGIPVDANIIATTNVICNGAANGSIDVQVLTGLAPLSYSWSKNNVSGFSITEDISDLAPGFYQLLVTDANGSTDTVFTSISEPATLTAAASGTNNLCFGSTLGTATAIANGGTSPYSYLWSNGEISASINNLPAGTFTVVITDANGCSANASYTVTQPSVLAATATGTNNLCFGSSQGTASVTANGGTSPYSYLWSNGQTTSTINNLAAGIYNVGITDANGCATNAAYTVTQPSLLTANATGVSTACSNTASVLANGGTSPYSFLWSNGATTPNVNNLAAGTYTVNVTDALGCVAIASVTVTAKEAFNPLATVTNVLCYGQATGSLNVSAGNGGTAPFQYSLDGISFQVDNVFNNLPAGTYTITVKDVNGCAAFVTKTITQPSLLAVFVNSIQKTCFGSNTGAITITAIGGSAAYSYSWSGPNNFTSTQRDIQNLATGSYNITVTDNNGCIKQATAIVTSLNEISVSATVINIGCRGFATGSISLIVSGGSGVGFNYLWNNGAVTSTIENLVVGNYTVNITDVSTGCSSTRLFTILQPASTLNFTATKTNATGCLSLGTITAVGSGGTAPYMYRLDGTAYQFSGLLTNLYGGNYNVTVRDANGCTITKAVSITDNGSDEYESNNSKSKAAAINVGNSISARIALSTDVADWFKFTTSSTGTVYNVTMNHPSINYTFNIYALGNNTLAMVPLDSSVGMKQYTLTPNTVYYVQVTGGISFTCYNLQINAHNSLSRNSFNVNLQKNEDEIVDKISATAFPNPHNGNFNLKISSPLNNDAIIDLYTMQGQKLAERKIKLLKGENLISFKGIIAGTVIYKINTDNKIITGKIIGF